MLASPGLEEPQCGYLVKALEEASDAVLGGEKSRRARAHAQDVAVGVGAVLNAKVGAHFEEGRLCVGAREVEGVMTC